jgi:acetoin utilization protein AcuB
MRIANLMTREPVRVGPQDTLEKVQTLMKQGGFRRIPVVQGDSIVGILTERDLRAHHSTMAATLVNSAMSAPVVTLDAGASVEEAARVMLRNKIGGLPIVERGKLVGILTSSDVLKAFLHVVDATKKIMEP